jgi:hypothetical protein
MSERWEVEIGDRASEPIAEEIPAKFKVQRRFSNAQRTIARAMENQNSGFRRRVDCRANVLRVLTLAKAQDGNYKFLIEGMLKLGMVPVS